MNCWHLIRVMSGKEQLLAERLTTLSIPTFCPMKCVTSIIRGHRREQLHALFATYLFVYYQPNDPYTWHIINDQATRQGGLLEVLGDKSPVPMPPNLIEQWIARANEQNVIEDLQNQLANYKYGFSAGDEVVIKDVGAYNSLRGICAWIDYVREVAGIKVSMLGRDLVIERGVREVTKADAAKPALQRKRGRRGGVRSRQARDRYKVVRHGVTVE